MTNKQANSFLNHSHLPLDPSRMNSTFIDTSNCYKIKKFLSIVCFFIHFIKASLFNEFAKGQLKWFPIL